MLQWAFTDEIQLSLHVLTTCRIMYEQIFYYSLLHVFELSICCLRVIQTHLLYMNPTLYRLFLIYENVFFFLSLQLDEEKKFRKKTAYLQQVCNKSGWVVFFSPDVKEKSLMDEEQSNDEENSRDRKKYPDVQQKLNMIYSPSRHKKIYIRKEAFNVFIN